MRRLFLSLIALLLIGAGCANAGPLQHVLTPPATRTGGCTSTGILPGDNGVAGLTNGYGACGLALNRATLPVFDVISGGVTYTIRAINGYPDVNRLAKIGGVSPTTGVIGLPVPKVYDQFGGADCTQATSAQQLSLWLINGKVYLANDSWFFDFISSTTTPRFCSNTSVTTHGQATSVYMAVQQGTEAGPGYASASASLYGVGPGCCAGGANQGSNGYVSGNGGALASPATFNWNTFASFPPTVLLPTESNPAVMGWISGATNLAYTQNEESAASASAMPADTPVGLSIGNTSFNDNPNASGAFARIQAMLVYGNTALSAGNQTITKNALKSRFNIVSPPTSGANVLVDGASIDASQCALVGGVQGYGWVEQMQAQIPYPFRLINTSKTGATIATLTATFATGQAKAFNGSFAKNVLIGPSFAAANSINGGRTGAQAFSDLQAYLVAAKAAGFTSANIIVSTQTGTGELANYNTLVRANAVGTGYVVADIAADTVLNNATTANPFLFCQPSPFTGHFTVAGYSIVAADYVPVIRQVIGQ